jgi:hypothetical protein
LRYFDGSIVEAAFRDDVAAVTLACTERTDAGMTHRRESQMDTGIYFDPVQLEVIWSAATVCCPSSVSGTVSAVTPHCA